MSPALQCTIISIGGLCAPNRVVLPHSHFSPRDAQAPIPILHPLSGFQMNRSNLATSQLRSASMYRACMVVIQQREGKI